jgi:NADH-quinone oxidoreductase subunit L
MFLFETTNIDLMVAQRYVFNSMTLNNRWASFWNFIISVGFVSALLLKSAQFVFFPWLLTAMEAPVPISAQLHSSTLVIIGFYIYVRFSQFIEVNAILMNIMFWSGITTIVAASVLGFYQMDGKKLLACSTASQLGYVVVAFSLGLIEEGLLLLVFCCCNKAAVFVWFGRFMESNTGLSDLRLIRYAHFTLIERAGLIGAILSATIVPGSFGWHVKGLFSMGVLHAESYFTLFGFAILSLTWFFSSLYLFKLLIVLLTKPESFVGDPKPKTEKVDFDGITKQVSYGDNFETLLICFTFQLFIFGLCGFSFLGYGSIIMI